MPLYQRGFFKNPPDIIFLDNSHYQVPAWPALEYLIRVAAQIPAEAIQLASKIPPTDNPRVEDGLIRIALAVAPELSLPLVERICNFVDSKYPWGGRDFGQLISHWAKGGEKEVLAAFRLSRKVISFKPDPKSAEKTELRQTDPDAYGATLEPQCRFNHWDYQAIFNGGIRELKQIDPATTLKMLVAALDDYLKLRMDSGALSSEGELEDHSYIWCRHIEGLGDSPEPRRALVHATTEAALACFDLFSANSEKLGEVNQFISRYRWTVIKRIKQHVYAKYPAQSVAWIREEVLAYKDFHNRDYRYEFAAMIRAASEHFGPDWMPVEEMDRIYNKIVTGPDQKSYREWLGDNYSEELFSKRQRYFHKIQLWPFETTLSPQGKEYLQKLIAEDGKPLTIASYAPFESDGVHQILNESPIAIEELRNRTDPQLIQTFNGWNTTIRDPDRWWIERSIEGLSRSFAQLISDDPNRFAAWSTEWELLTRPIYLRRAIEFAKKDIEDGKIERLDGWFRLCRLLASKKNRQGVSRNDLSATSAAAPDWSWTQQGILEFLQICMSEKKPIALTWRPAVAELLAELCYGYDGSLDDPTRKPDGIESAISVAINSVRGKALEALFDFMQWILQNDRTPHIGFTKAKEIQEILERRIGGHPPLTKAEYALLGCNFNRLSWYGGEWARNHSEIIFPEDTETWLVAFGNYLSFQNAVTNLYETLAKQYERAVSQLDNLEKDGKPSPAAEHLGFHLFLFYVWERIEIKDGPLEAFYAKAKPATKERVMNSIGMALRSSGDLKGNVKDRIEKFVQFRIDQAGANPTKEACEELNEFVWWMDAEGMDPKWKLEKLKQILTVAQVPDHTGVLVERLADLLTSDVDLVCECFTLLCRAGAEDRQVHFDVESGKKIIEAGLSQGNSQTRMEIEAAQSRLLKAGRFEFRTKEMPR